MEAEVTHFYLTNYIDSFSTPDVDLAYAQIPQVGAQQAALPPSTAGAPLGKHPARRPVATGQSPRACCCLHRLLD